MRPKPLPSRGDDLSQPRLDAIIDARHPLVQLAGLIDWARFDAAFGSLYAETGRPGLPTRLMVGLHLLKHMKGVSDEEICAQWVENPYMQAFCGEAFFRHVLPLDRSSLTRWRTRIGADPLEALLAETIAAATRSEALPPERLERPRSMPACRPRPWPTQPTATGSCAASNGSRASARNTGFGCASRFCAWPPAPSVRWAASSTPAGMLR